MQRHPLCQLFGTAGHAPIAWHAYGPYTRHGRIAAARIGDPVSLALEGFGTRKGGRIVKRHEYGGAPPCGRVGPTMAGQSSGQGLDDERQPKAFMAVLLPAQRHDGTWRIGSKNGWITAGFALRIQHAIVIELAARLL